MSNRRYRLTSQALADLDDIAAYLGDRNPHAADRVIDTLIGSFSMLGEHPGLGTKRDDLRVGLRTFTPARPAHSYVVLYYQAAPSIEISAIIHGARDWPNLIVGSDR